MCLSTWWLLVQMPNLDSNHVPWILCWSYWIFFSFWQEYFTLCYDIYWINWTKQDIEYCVLFISKAELLGNVILSILWFFVELSIFGMSSTNPVFFPLIITHKSPCIVASDHRSIHIHVQCACRAYRRKMSNTVFGKAWFEPTHTSLYSACRNRVSFSLSLSFSGCGRSLRRFVGHHIAMGHAATHYNPARQI